MMDKDSLKNILLAVLTIIVIVLLCTTIHKNDKVHVAENNIVALTDTLKSYKLKNGELLYEKQGYIADKTELEKYIGIKEKEINELERKLNSTIASICDIKTQVHIDTVVMKDSSYTINDSIYNEFYFDNKWVNIKGITLAHNGLFNTTINNISIDVPVRVGLTGDNAWFVTTPNPYVKISDIKGANLEKKKQNRWSLGVQIGVGGFAGYGICTPFGKAYSGPIFGAGIYVGVGASYRLL